MIALVPFEGELVIHVKDLLNIGEDHLGVDPLIVHHGEHVLRCKKVRHPS